MGRQSENVRTRILLLILGLGGLCFVVCWPAAERMAFSAKNLGFYVYSRVTLDLSQQMIEAWNYGLFRPLDVLASRLGDPIGRSALASLLLHLPALAATVGGLALLVRRLFSASGTAFLTAFLSAFSWWLLNPGTTVALWQPDTVSQSWSGAAGLWLVIFLWSAVQRINSGQSISRFLAAEVFICLIGVLTKETFLGWAASGGLLLAVLWLKSAVEGRKTSAKHWLALFTPIVLVPSLYLVARFYWGGLGVMLSDPGGRYTLHLGFTLVKNTITAAAGFLCVGPVHLVSVRNASLLLRSLPFIGILLTVGIVLLPLGALRFSPKTGDGAVRWFDAYLIAMACFASLSPTLPSGGFSELYLMGPNVGVALLVGMSLASAFAHREARRTLYVVIAVALFSTGWFGLVSRAKCFAVTWKASRHYNQELMSLQQGLHSGAAPTRVMLRRNCAEGPVHSVYVLPPAEALNVGATERLLNHLHPDKKLEIFVEPDKRWPSPRVLEVDCSQ